MVSVWYPASHAADAPSTPYLPRRIASFYDQSSAELGFERGAVDFAGARSHAETRAAVDSSAGPAPVLLFSPGGGLPRMLATTLVEDLVSHGYVVVTVDSTGQAPVEFPTGLRGPDRDLELADALSQRVTDLSFVLDELHGIQQGTNPDLARRPLPTGLARLLDLDRVGAFGHSLGGFVVAEGMGSDPRILAGANLDGSVKPEIGRAALQGVDRPLLLMGAGQDGDSARAHNHVEAPDCRAFWQASTGWKRDVYFQAGEHLSFSDYQTVLPQVAAQRASIKRPSPPRSVRSTRPSACRPNGCTSGRSSISTSATSPSPSSTSRRATIRMSSRSRCGDDHAGWINQTLRLENRGR